jgi:ArsR family transcriptional regulator
MMTAKATAKTLTAIAAGFHALSDPTRIEVIELLREGEQCVCELMDELDTAQSRLSFHLKVLREAGLVTDRRDGRWVYYTLDTHALGALEAYLSGVRRSKGKNRWRRSSQCC